MLLQLAGAFGDHTDGLLVLGALAVNLMIGLGDDPEAVEHSMLATLATRPDAPDTPTPPWTHR